MKKSNRLSWLVISSICAIMLLMSASLSAFSLSTNKATSPCIHSMTGSKRITGNGKIVTKSYGILPFGSIQICGNFDITIKASQESHVDITTDLNLLPYLRVSPTSKELLILPQADTSLIPTKIARAIISTPALHKLYIGGDNIVRASNISSDKLTLTAGGKSLGYLQGSIQNLQINLGGKSEFHIKVDHAKAITLDFGGESEVYLSGIAKNLTINAAGKSFVNAKNLTADNVTISSAGKSDITVHAVKKLAVTSAGNSNIKYYGNPTISKTSFGKTDLQELSLP